MLILSEDKKNLTLEVKNLQSIIITNDYSTLYLLCTYYKKRT